MALHICRYMEPPRWEVMPNSFLSKTQLLMINQLQDVSTRRSSSTAYRYELSTQLTKTFGSKRPAVDLSLTVVFCSKKNLASVDQRNYEPLQHHRWEVCGM